MRRKIKWKSITVWLMGIILFVCGGYAFLSTDNSVVRQVRESWNLQEISEKLFPRREDYSFETCYSGDPALPDKLFEQPFARTEEYICNKDLINKYGVTNFKQLAEKAKENLSLIFDLAYRDLEMLDELPDIFWYGYRITDGQSSYSGNEDMMNFIHDVYMENHTSMETDIITDKSLIFYDQNNYIVRCMLYLTPYECDDVESLAQVLGVERIELGETYSKIVEVSYVTMEDGSDFNEYRIAEIRFLEEEEKEEL